MGAYVSFVELAVAEQGYSLTFRAPGDSTPAIKEYDAPNFDHVIVFAPHTKSTLYNDSFCQAFN